MSKKAYARVVLSVLFADIDIVCVSVPEQETLPHQNDPNQGEWD